jgi:ABC-type multidrug transport system ATPase subunit
MKPQIMILDEPTSMLDPLGKDFIFDILTSLKSEQDLTLIVVEHNIEQVAPLSDRIVLMYDGNVAKDAPPVEFFENSEFLFEHGINPPQATAFLDRLKADGIYAGPLTVDLDEAAQISAALLQNDGSRGQVS